MLTIRATKKLLDRCSGPFDDLQSTTRLGDWYATVLFWKPWLALFVNEATRLPVFVPYAPQPQLLSRFVEAFCVLADSIGVDPHALTQECDAMRECVWTTTASRSVLGSMNEFVQMAKNSRRLGHDRDAAALSSWLAPVPCSPLYDGPGSPDRALLIELGGAPRRAGRLPEL